MALIPTDTDDEIVLPVDDADDDGPILESQETAVQVDDTDDETETLNPDQQQPTQQPQNRKARKAERAREHRELNQLREALAESNRRLMELGERTTTATETMAEAISRRDRPQPKPMKERIQERLERASSRVRPRDEDNGESAKAYFQEVAAIVDEAATENAKVIAQEAIAEYQRSQPPPVAPEVAGLFSMAPWLRDPLYNQAVKHEIRRLGKNRNLRDDNVWQATAREAIGRVAGFYDLEVIGGASQGPRRSPAVGGPGGRGTMPGGSGESTRITMSPNTKRMADEHPKYGRMPAPQRYVAYYKEIIKPEL